MKKTFVFFIALTNLFTITVRCSESEADVFLDVGYRKDHLKWSVSSQPDANILVKESWKNLKTTQFGGEINLYFHDHFYINAKGDYGKLISGRKSYDEIDLDEIVSFDEDEWLKANTKGHVYDFSCCTGYLFPLFNNHIVVIPLIGYSCHFQKFIDSHYTDSIFLLNVFEDVQSSYSYQWKGPWIGFCCSYLFCNNSKVSFEYQYHWFSYHGTIKDNFVTHDNEIQKNHHVHGHNVSVKIISPSWNDYAIGLLGNYQFTWGKNGTDTVDGKNFKLKKIEWGSANIFLTLLKSF